jgi:hypothetical protein
MTAIDQSLLQPHILAEILTCLLPDRGHINEKIEYRNALGLIYASHETLKATRRLMECRDREDWNEEIEIILAIHDIHTRLRKICKRKSAMNQMYKAWAGAFVYPFPGPLDLPMRFEVTFDVAHYQWVGSRVLVDQGDFAGLYVFGRELESMRHYGPTGGSAKIEYPVSIPDLLDKFILDFDYNEETTSPTLDPVIRALEPDFFNDNRLVVPFSKMKRWYAESSKELAASYRLYFTIWMSDRERNRAPISAPRLIRQCVKYSSKPLVCADRILDYMLLPWKSGGWMDVSNDEKRDDVARVVRYLADSYCYRSMYGGFEIWLEKLRSVRRNTNGSNMTIIDYMFGKMCYNYQSSHRHACMTMLLLSAIKALNREMVRTLWKEYRCPLPSLRSIIKIFAPMASGMPTNMLNTEINVDIDDEDYDDAGNFTGVNKRYIWGNQEARQFLPFLQYLCEMDNPLPDGTQHFPCLPKLVDATAGRGQAFPGKRWQ